MLVVDLVERRFELTRLLVDRELVHYRIVHHERQSINEPFLRDGLHLRNARPCNALGNVFLFGLSDRVVFFAATGHQGRCCSDDSEPLNAY